MAYTTIELVSAALNGVNIASSTVPATSTVNQWIAESDNEIDVRTGKVWSSTTESSVIMDYDGSGYLRFPHAPIQSITSLEYQTQGLGADTSAWSTLTEGRTNDFILYGEDGEVKFFGSNVPTSGFQNIRATYVRGPNSTPAWVQRLSTLMTSKRFVESVVNASAQEEGGSVTVGNISITDPSNFGSSQLLNIDNEIDMIFSSKINQSHIFRGSRDYSLRGRL